MCGLSPCEIGLRASLRKCALKPEELAEDVPCLNSFRGHQLRHGEHRPNPAPPFAEVADRVPIGGQPADERREGTGGVAHLEPFQSSAKVAVALADRVDPAGALSRRRIGSALYRVTRMAIASRIRPRELELFDRELADGLEHEEPPIPSTTHEALVHQRGQRVEIGIGHRFGGSQVEAPHEDA